MDPEKEVNAGSESSGEQPAPEVETAPAAPAPEAPAPEVPAEQKTGDACTCPDGRPGTLQPVGTDHALVCVPNEVQG